MKNARKKRRKCSRQIFMTHFSQLTTQNSRKLAVWLATAALFATPLVMAQSNQSTAQVEQKSTWDTVKEHLKLQYLGELQGPSVNHPYSTNAIDGDPSNGSAIQWDNKISAGYRINKQWVTDATFDFAYNPLGKTAGVIDPSNVPFVLKDPFLRVSNNRIVHTDLFNLSGDMRLYLPLGDSARSNGSVMGLRNTLFSSVSVPNSKWSFGHFSLARVNAYNGMGKGDLFSALVSVHGEYAFTDTLGLYLWSDLWDMSVSRGGNYGADPLNVQAGVSWDVAKNINLNPYFKFLPGYLSFNTTTFNLKLTASIF